MSGVHLSSSSSAFPAISLEFTFFLLLLHSQLYLWGSPFFFFCLPQLYLWSSPFFFFCLTQLYLWGSPFFFFCIPSYISGVHLSSSSSSAFPAICLGFTFLLLLLSSSAISLGFTILLLLHSQLYLWSSPFFFFCLPQLYLWGSPFFFFCLPQLYLRASPFFFFCLPNYMSGVHLSSSSSAFPAISLEFTFFLLLLHSQLYLWGSPFFFFCLPQLYLWSSPFFFFCLTQLYLWGSPFFFFCIPSYISGVHLSSSSSSAFPAISLEFTFLLLLPSPVIYQGFTILLFLPSQLYVWDSPFFFFVFCLPSYISGVHLSSSSAFPSYISGLHHSSFSAFPAICLGFTFLLLLLLPSPAYQ